jgi:hypothetical protein
MSKKDKIADKAVGEEGAKADKKSFGFKRGDKV